MVNKAAQDPHTGGMEGGDPDALRAKAHQVVHTVPHLSGRLIGKGDGHDIPRIHILLLNQVCNTVSQYPGLSGTCSCQD